MRRPRGPLFLARRGYRRQRMRDGARMLPVFGAFLVFFPLLWEPGLTEGRDTAPDGIYLFVVWAGLIAVAMVLAPGLSGPEVEDPPGSDPGSGSGSGHGGAD